MSFQEGCFETRNRNASTYVKLLRLLSPLVLQKMKENYFSQLDDYDEPICEQ